MKSRTSKKSARGSKRKKGLGTTAKVIGATTAGLLAGGLAATALAKRNRPVVKKAGSWVKSAATSPAMKTLVTGIAKTASRAIVKAAR